MRAYQSQPHTREAGRSEPASGNRAERMTGGDVYCRKVRHHGAKADRDGPEGKPERDAAGGGAGPGALSDPWARMFP